MIDQSPAPLLYFVWADDVLFVVDNKDCLPPDIKSYGEIRKTPAQIQTDIETLGKYNFSVSVQIGELFYETPGK